MIVLQKVQQSVQQTDWYVVVIISDVSYSHTSAMSDLSPIATLALSSNGGKLLVYLLQILCVSVMACNHRVRLFIIMFAHTSLLPCAAAGVYCTA